MFSRLASLEHRRQSRILQRLQQASADDVQRHAEERLAEMLLWCKQRVPYYRRYLGEVADRHIQQSPAEVLSDLPVLEKSDLHEHFEELTADGRPGIRIRRNATGGSTGEAAQFLQDAAYRRWNRALAAHFESWTGCGESDARVVLWGVPRDLESGGGAFVRLRSALLNRKMLDAYQMSAESMSDYAAVIRKVRPRLLRVLAQSGVELAKHVKKQGGGPLPVGAVVSTGGTLSSPERELMQDAFGAPVFNVYGSREVGPMASEARAGEGLLVCPASHRVEILNADGSSADPGDPGEVVVTLLINRIMPLVRYRIGDMAEWIVEPKGSPAWPCLGGIHGRVMDHFVAADGTLVNSEYFTHLMYPMEWVRRFQWIQESKSRVRLRIEANPGVQAADEAALSRTRLESNVRAALGQECALELELVNAIRPSPSGKYRFTISRLHPEAAT